MKNKILDYVFDPAHFRVYFYDYSEDVDETSKRNEAKLYHQVVEGLTNDLLELGIEVNFSSDILIREVAQNLLVMQRLKFSLMSRGILKPKKGIDYDEEEIEPLYEQYLPKLQRQINEGLKQLGLLPSQQIERQKLTIVRRLRQRFEESSKELTLTAKKEIRGLMISKKQPLQKHPVFESKPEMLADFSFI